MQKKKKYLHIEIKKYFYCVSTRLNVYTFIRIILCKCTNIVIKSQTKFINFTIVILRLVNNVKKIYFYNVRPALLLFILGVFF